MDTSAAGGHEGTVTVDSDGGSATILVRVRVEPTTVRALGAASAITHSKAVPSGPEAARPGKRAAHPAAAPAPGTDVPLPPAQAGPDGGTYRGSVSTQARDQAAAASTPAAQSPGPDSAGIQEGREDREQAGSGPPPGAQPAASVPPRVQTPPAQGKPAGKRRRRVPARAVIVAGAGIGVAIVVLIAVMLGSQHATPPRAGAGSPAPSPTVIFRDDFSTTANNWKDWFHQADGYYSGNGTYLLTAKAGGNGEFAQLTTAAHNLGSKTPLSLSISVDARRITGSPQGTGYGITCRADGNGNSYDFVINDNGATIEKWVNDGAENQGPPVVSTPVVRADGTNQLRAICMTSEGGQVVHLAFWVNGTKVVDWIDRNHPYTTGFLGVTTGTAPSTKTAAKAEFDNFVVAQF